MLSIARTLVLLASSIVISQAGQASKSSLEEYAGPSHLEVAPRGGPF